MPRRIFSFSYRYGSGPVRTDNDLVIDARVLANPYVHGKTGLDKEVQRKVFSTPYAESLVARGVLHLRENPEGRVLIGCTFGRHRSVAIAERIALLMGEKATHTSRRMRGE